MEFKIPLEQIPLLFNLETPKGQPMVELFKAFPNVALDECHEDFMTPDFVVVLVNVLEFL
jgi:hypothetical protein